MTADAATGPRTRRSWVRPVLLLLIAAGLIAAFFLLPIKQLLAGFVDWIRGLGIWGPVLLAAAYVPAAVLLVPGSILTLGAGFAFGVLGGTAAVSVGSVLGASAAFFTGRTIARGWVEERVARRPRFRAVDEAVAKEGFKIVLLTRLSPVFPFNFLNYAYGITQVSFRDFLLASWIGMLPGTVLYVYLGSAVKSLADITSGGVEGGTGRTILFGIGLLATAAVTIVITRTARRALRESVPDRERS